MNRDTGDTEQLGQIGWASPTTDQDVSDGALSSWAGSVEQLGYLGEPTRTPASFPIIIHEYTSLDSSVSSRDLSPIDIQDT